MFQFNDSNIIYEDAFILVINKEHGLVVNRSTTSPQGTLQDALDIRLQLNDVDKESEFYLRSGIVHRLDKETSGVLIVAKTPTAFDYLQKQFKDREVKKEYIALVFGQIQDAVLEISAPLKRDSRNRLKFAVVEDGKDALTRVQKLKDIILDLEKYTLVKASPKTGRTHQIRVHLGALGHNIVGDKLYSTTRQQQLAQAHFNRMMLHAHKITFKHPNTNAEVTFEAPIPEAFLI